MFHTLGLSLTTRIPSHQRFLYVFLAQANPPNLMATIQYVNFFGGSAVNSGECSYWFAQFQTAVTFIQSIDDRTENPQEM